MVMQNNIFADLLETDPIGQRTLFQSFLPTNSNPFQQTQFQSLFEPTFNSFLGALGAQIREGEAPSLSFNDFLSEQFNPQRALLRQPNAQGVNAGGPTIFNFNRR